MIGQLLNLMRWSSASQKCSTFRAQLDKKSFGLRRNRPAGSPCVDRVHYVIGALMAAGKKTQQKPKKNHWRGQSIKTIGVDSQLSS